MLRDLRFRAERAEAELQHANRKIAGLLSRDSLALGFQETERRVRDASRRTFDERKSVDDGSHNSSNADDPDHTRGHRRTSSTPVDLENTDAGDADLELRLASAAAAAMAGVLALSGGDSPPTFGVTQRSRASPSASTSRSSSTSLLREARSGWAAFISEEQEGGDEARGLLRRSTRDSTDIEYRSSSSSARLYEHSP